MEPRITPKKQKTDAFASVFFICAQGSQLFQQLFEPCFVHGGRVPQGELDPQPVVFLNAQLVERQEFELLQVGEALGVRLDQPQVFQTVGQSGHDHMPHPERHALHGGQLQKALDLPEIRAAVLAVIRFGKEFQVAEHKVGVPQHALGRREVAHARGIERGVHAVLVQLCEEFFDKPRLHQRLAAGDGHTAAVPPIGAEAQRLARELVRGVRFAALRQPGVRVVAVNAAQRAALHEYDVAHARPVDRAKRLDGVDIACHFCSQPFISLQGDPTSQVGQKCRCVRRVHAWQGVAMTSRLLSRAPGPGSGRACEDVYALFYPICTLWGGTRFSCRVSKAGRRPKTGTYLCARSAP